MGSRDQERDRLDAWQAWWGFVSRVLGFLVGVALLALDHKHLTLLEVAIVAPLMGPAIVTGAVQMLTAARGGK
jgi:ABC-type spermidine/putrescine transport system permease subunit II